MERLVTCFCIVITNTLEAGVPGVGLKIGLLFCANRLRISGELNLEAITSRLQWFCCTRKITLCMTSLCICCSLSLIQSDGNGLLGLSTQTSFILSTLRSYESWHSLQTIAKRSFSDLEGEKN